MSKPTLAAALLGAAQLACACASALVSAPVSVQAQAGTPVSASVSMPLSDTRLTVDRIFRSAELRTIGFQEIHWLKDGESYIDMAPTAGGFDIVRVNVLTGKSTVLVPASALVTPNGKIAVEDMQLSGDETKALLFHNSQRVWRQNTKGEYTVVDLVTKQVTPIAPGTAPKMFAKFSPDGKQVAFVRENNLFVVDLTTGAERQLTTDGSEQIINGTSDWVYEEEFDLRDGFRWSPDSRAIAFWRFDQSKVPLMTLMNQTDSLYPSLFQYKYPKAGQPNSTVKIGVVWVVSGAPRYMQTGDSTLYIPRIGWVGSDSLWIERMPRKQNQAELLMASAATGGTRRILVDTDSAYVDVFEPLWINNNKQLLWLSDRSGWRAVHVANRDGSGIRQITSTGMDVLEIIGLDSARNDLYVKVAAPTAAQSQVYRYPLLARRAPVRVTPRDGSYEFNMSPTAKYASVTYSTLNDPPSAGLYELPSMRLVRSLGDNAALKRHITALGLSPVQQIKIPAADGKTMLDAYRIVPPAFDSTKKHPVLMYAYGGPAIPQVLDRWGGSRYFFHQMLAQQGYVVIVADNRGAAWRGRDFRKGTQYKLGVQESDDQIAVAKWAGRQSWGDSTRIAMWGWSYGGYNTTMSAFRGGSVFKLAIAVAPVTDWRYYDSIYTERFMWLPSENAEGYKASSAFSYIDGLKAKFLLIFGDADDNVHPQNSDVLVQKLQLARKPFSVMFFPNKNHSISGQGGTLPLYDLLQRFITENL